MLLSTLLLSLWLGIHVSCAIAAGREALRKNVLRLVYTLVSSHCPSEALLLRRKQT